MLLQGRGVSVANDRPIFGCSKLAHFRRNGNNEMAFIPAAETWRVAIQYTNSQGNTAYNIMYVKDDLADNSPARGTQLATIFENWAQTVWETLAVTEWAMTNVQCRYMDTEFNTFINYDMNVPGAVVGDALPSTVTIAISFRTNLSGRSFRGRAYHVGLGDGTFNGDLIDLGQRTVLINGYETLRSDLLADDFRLAIASFVSEGAPRAAALVTPVEFITITDLVADQQRRRKPRL
jgi:hypothetical protein